VTEWAKIEQNEANAQLASLGSKVAKELLNFINSGS